MIYDLLWSDPLSLISYVLLLFSILSLWVKNEIKVWGLMATSSLACGVLSGRISLIGIVSIVVLGLLYYAVNHAKLKISVRAVAGVFAVILSVLLATHLVPGFNNWKIVDSVSLSEKSQPYSMYLNMDKTMIGLIILGLGFPLIKSLKEWGSVFLSTLPVFLIGVIILAGISFILGYTRWDFKFPDLFFVWALKNLFFTCVTEEAFFRGFLQRILSEKLRNYKYGDISSLITASVLFGVAHFAGGPQYILLATVAGVVYGYAYQRTQRIEAGILCHFGVNSLHFIFSTYPALVQR